MISEKSVGVNAPHFSFNDFYPENTWEVFWSISSVVCHPCVFTMFLPVYRISFYSPLVYTPNQWCGGNNNQRWAESCDFSRTVYTLPETCRSPLPQCWYSDPFYLASCPPHLYPLTIKISKYRFCSYTSVKCSWGSSPTFSTWKFPKGPYFNVLQRERKCNSATLSSSHC